MFGFFKKKPSVNSIEEVSIHLAHMGYSLLPYGVGVAQLELMSGYNAIETASHIALTTLALDVRNAGNDIVALTAFVPHGMALLEVLKNFKDNGKINPTQWANDANAIFHIVHVDQNQEEWIKKILSDPIAGKERLAISNIN